MNESWQVRQHDIRCIICTDLHEVLGELAVAFPELVEGEVHAAVVHQVFRDGERVSLRNAVPQQTLTQDDHEALPVTARHLREERGKSDINTQ